MPRQRDSEQALKERLGWIKTCHDKAKQRLIDAVQAHADRHKISKDLMHQIVISLEEIITAEFHLQQTAREYDDHCKLNGKRFPELREYLRKE